MKLSKLFNNYHGIVDPDIKGIATNTKDLNPGELFLCIKGATIDRHDFIKEAVDKGAVAIVASKEVETTVPVIYVDDVNKRQDEIISHFYDYPQNKIKIIGITGTDGKTSTSTIIQTLLGDNICGYIGTNGIACKGYYAESPNTTPAKNELLKQFSIFIEKGIKYVALETSSEAFYYHRLDGLRFSCAAISNLTSEHLNTHKTLTNYIDCKKHLFINNDGPSILNKDDAHFMEFYEVSKNVLTYGKDKDNTLVIASYTIFPHKTEITYLYNNQSYEITSPLTGDFNVYNLAESILVCLSLGYKMEDIIKKIPLLKVSGRMEYIDCGQDFIVIVDYAHTPNGVKTLFNFVNKIKHHNIYTVSGQAGGRDAIKRKFVGENIARNSTYAYWTLEDPRNEKVSDIAKDMSENIKDLNNYEVIEDREEAIRQAILKAQTNDIVLILGKGSETSNVINGIDVPYPGDIECAKKAILEKLKND